MDLATDSLVVGRVTLLHPSVLAAVAGTEVEARAGALIDRSRASLHEATVLGDLLHDAVGRARDHPARSSLVAVRRSVHAGRAPGRHVWTEEVRHHLGADLSSRIERWAEDAAELEKDVETLDAWLDADGPRRNEALREACEDPWFRHGLAAASPSLARALGAWLERPEKTPRRRTLLALTRYLSRAATKTSPFSSFNYLVGGGLTDQDQAVSLDLSAPRSVLEVDPVAWQRATGAVRPDTPLPLEVDPTLLRDAEQLAHLGPPWDERWSSVPASAALDVALDAVRQTGERGFTAVVDRLTASAGASRDQVAAFVERLLAHRLVRPRVTFPPRDLPPELTAPDDGAATESVHNLGGHLGRERATPAQATADREGLLREVRALWPSNTSPVGDAVHDTLVCGPGSLFLDRSTWAPALADLDKVLGWLPLFDPLLGYRLAVAELFRREHGERVDVPLLSWHRTLSDLATAGPRGRHRDLVPFLDPAHVTRPELLDDSGVHPLTELAALRRRWRAEALPPETTSGEVWSCPPEVLARQLREAPSYLTGPPSLTSYVQPVTSHDGARLVLMTVHGGDGRGRSRWTWLAGAPAPAAVAVDGAEAVGLDGLWGSALGLHTPTTRRSIEYPGEPPRRGQEGAVRLRDLSVRLGERDGLLALGTGDGRLRVAYGSMMSEAFAPPLARLLLGCFTTSYLQHSSLPVVHTPRPDPEGATRRGRVEVGRVTLARAAWAFPLAAVPRRKAAGGEARHLVRMAAWADQHGVPREVFVRPGGVEGGAAQLGKTHKPMYLDLRHPLLLEILDKLVESLEAEQRDGAGERWLVLEEARPRPGAQPGAPMVELVLERRRDH